MEDGNLAFTKTARGENCVPTTPRAMGGGVDDDADGRYNGDEVECGDKGDNDCHEERQQQQNKNQTMTAHLEKHISLELPKKRHKFLKHLGGLAGVGEPL